MEYPIVVKRLGEHYEMTCRCGNTGSDRFIKYLATKIEVDERGRKHARKEWELMCKECNTSIGYDELNEQYKQDTKTLTVEKATEIEYTEKTAQSGVQNI